MDPASALQPDKFGAEGTGEWYYHGTSFESMLLRVTYYCGVCKEADSGLTVGKVPTKQGAVTQEKHRNLAPFAKDAKDAAPARSNAKAGPPGYDQIYQLVSAAQGGNTTESYTYDPVGNRLTGPTFCTTASERVYITTSSGKDANGGAQGAVGDRRAAICGAIAAGAGGL
jgi:YD repeat-containing protein